MVVTFWVHCQDKHLCGAFNLGQEIAIDYFLKSFAVSGDSWDFFPFLFIFTFSMSLIVRQIDINNNTETMIPHDLS